MAFQVSYARRRACRAGFLAGIVAVLAACAPQAAVAVPGPPVSTPLYPDVRALPPYDVVLGRETVNFERHYVIRFSTAMYNAGPGRLEIHGTPKSLLDLNFTASQWIYEDPAGLRIEEIGTLFWHQAHRHFHFDDYGRYELWTKRNWDRAVASGFTAGSPLAGSRKVSFCMLDSMPVDSSASSQSFYNTCTPAMEGISPGWADVYDWTLPDQWIDVGTSRLPDGVYVLRNIADPDHIIWEGPDKADTAKDATDATSGTTTITIRNGQLAAS